MIFIWKSNSLIGYENNSYLTNYHITIDEYFKVSNYLENNDPKLFIDPITNKPSNIRYQLFLSDNIKALIEYISKSQFTSYKHSSTYVSYISNITNNFLSPTHAKTIAEDIINHIGYKVLQDDLSLYL